MTVFILALLACWPVWLLIGVLAYIEARPRPRT
ncbi:hypothetical protein CVAR21S_00699 [Corynebacterium variabile]